MFTQQVASSYIFVVFDFPPVRRINDGRLPWFLKSVK